MDSASKLKTISRNIGKSKKVESFDRGHEKESDVLAHSFVDIEETCSKLLNELLPKLIQDDLNETEINDLLLDIGEEFRHILYHIEDSKFYNYLSSK
jgi:hypothetical protein